jgi:uncharacterized protein (DUF1015 family)
LLREEAQPSLYLLDQRFEIDGEALSRAGLLARFRAEDYSTRRILPHEHTRKGPREDRFRLLRATRANFSPIFFMFSDAAGGFAAEAARIRERPHDVRYVDDHGVENLLWCVSDTERIAGLQQALAEPTSYIADGHHRYATALRYRDEVSRAGEWSFGYFAPMEDPGMRVLPYHRVLTAGPSLAGCRERLAAAFDLSDAADAAAGAAAAAASKAPYAFALAQPGGGALVVEARAGAPDLLPADTPPSLRALDAYFLHEHVLGLLGIPGDAVRYVHSLGEAVGSLDEADCKLVCLLRGTPVEQIVAVAEDGESMPTKSTLFHPKIPSALVVHELPKD